MIERDEVCRVAAVVVTAVVILECLGSVASTGQPSNGVPEEVVPEDHGQRKWTIAMYWVSDNDLDEYTDYFIDMWIEQLTNREDIALSVFLDRYDASANISTLTEEGWQETKDLGEVNSSSPETLSSFLNYSLTEPALKADNFMLIVQDHGNGYLGLCCDEGLPDSNQAKMWMSIDGLGSGIRDGLAISGGEIDIISLDACTLGIVEVAYELRDTASYMVASVLGVPFDGQNYIALLSGLSDDPDITPEELACKIVDDYGEWYSAPLGTYPTLYPYMQDFASLSVIDLRALGPLKDAFVDFRDTVLPKDAVLGKPFKDAAVYADASLWTNNMGTWFYPDIKTMFSEFSNSIRGQYPDVAAACDAIVGSTDAVVVHDWSSWRTKDVVTGLSVFVCPSIGVFEVHWDALERIYNAVGLDFVEDTGWDLVLMEYFYTTKMYGVPPTA
ncbi:MAG: hypothetical protein JSV90_02480 [Methanobacteriota archaeon]|nr:MAG: hypothetical protein JSV90_02480 [Euryarchaeota archaeon]